MSYTRIVPLGGLGEIGMNCLAVETPEGILVVDCGVTFPHTAGGGDVIHADLSYLWERRDDLLGVVVTHGHEDHIGALPYLLRMIPVPVWAPPYAATLIQNRLEEHREVAVPDVRHTTPRKRFTVGPFTVEPLRVTHSIPDSTALCIRTKTATVIHTGDFKFETDPLDGESSDEPRLRELGDEGVDLLLSDSTNIDVPVVVNRERDVAEALRAMIAPLPGRVVAGLFASNVFRIMSLLRAATLTGRKVCYLGRSVHTHVKAATELGRLKIPSDLIVSPEQAMQLPPREVLAIATGTQAEPASALSRLARGEHPNFKLERGDAAIFSSRTIPGNERHVWNLVCALERRGIDVHFRRGEGEIHVSGHASRVEQARMLELVRPRSFVPVHGTFHHLREHAKLAESMGVSSVRVIENGATLRCDRGTLEEDTAVATGRVHVDHGFELDEALINEREALASSGTVMATVPIGPYGLLDGEPAISTRGVLLDDAPENLLGEARYAIEEGLRVARGVRDVLPREEAREVVSRVLRRVYRVGSRRPLTVVHLSEGPASAPRPAKDRDR